MLRHLVIQFADTIFFLQIKEMKTPKQASIFYFIEDDFGGYEIENKVSIIDVDEIIRTVKNPSVRKISRRRNSYSFIDISDISI